MLIGKKTTLPLVVAMLCMCVLSGCIPNSNLPPRDTMAPPVTGPIDEFFPTDAYDVHMKQTNSADPSRIKGKEIASPAMPAQGDLKVALLLPLSGTASKAARDMQDAAMLAVYDSTSRINGGYSITLLPKDTADSPSVAANVAEQALKSGAKIIIGPLYSQSVNTVKAVAGNTPIIALSNNTDVKGTNCFIFGKTPEDEVRRVAEFGLKDGQLHWASLVPNNDYGMKLDDILSKTIISKGGQIVGSERYIVSKSGMQAAVERLAQKIRMTSVNALFLGDNVENSAYMLDLLAKQNIDIASLKLYGTSQWHRDTSAPSLFNGGYYAVSNEHAFQRFAKRFRATNGREPSDMAAVAYDAVMMVAEIAGHGKIPDRLEFLAKETMQGPATGAYRFENDGSVSRGLAVYQLTTSGKGMVENAPKQF